MNYYIITDTHLGHDAMITNCCKRPSNFSNRILNNISRVVNPNDVLIHTGDVCIGNDSYWHNMLVSSCKGRLWLIRGNHDNKPMAWYLSHGWSFVADEITLNMFGCRIIFSHVPIVRSLSESYINIHGHLHNNNHRSECLTDDRNYLVFIEHEYKPINLRKIIEYIDRKKKGPV